MAAQGPAQTANFRRNGREAATPPVSEVWTEKPLLAVDQRGLRRRYPAGLGVDEDERRLVFGNLVALVVGVGADDDDVAGRGFMRGRAVDDDLALTRRAGDGIGREALPVGAV